LSINPDEREWYVLKAEEKAGLYTPPEPEPAQLEAETPEPEPWPTWIAGPEPPSRPTRAAYRRPGLL